MKDFVKIASVAAICGSLLYTAVPVLAADWELKFNSEQARIYFGPHDRIVLRDYVDHAHRAYCPEGTLATAGGCAEQVAFYTPGTYLPDYVYYTELPDQVVAQISPPPPGTVYVRVHDNVYLMNRDNRGILNALSLLGAPE